MKQLFNQPNCAVPHWAKPIFLLVFFQLIATFTIFAQPPKIEGTIKDEKGNIIPNVSVKVKNSTISVGPAGHQTGAQP